MHPRPRLPVPALIGSIASGGIAAACLGLLMACGARTTSPAAFLPTPAATVEKSPPVVHMLDLLAALWNYDRGGHQKSQKISFEIPEAEVNMYLAYALRFAPRPGIESLKVQLLPNSEVKATAVLDLDAVGRWNPGTVPVALRPLLSGRREIQLDAQWQVHQGVLTFTLKNAYGPEHKEIPRKVAESIIRSIGSRQPEQYDISEPIELPFGLQRVWTENQLLCGET